MIKSHTKKLSTVGLALLITGAIDSIRNLPATALFGCSLIFFIFLSACIFLVPAALISAELTSADQHSGGIYEWTRRAFGDKVAVLAVWLQWINTMVWFPTILSFIAGTATYFLNPSFAQNKWYLLSTIITLFWLMTLINLRGVQTSAKIANICAFIGVIIPMAAIILLALIWLILGKPLQIHCTVQNLLPDLTHPNNWISLTAIMTAFLGMELATAHVKEVNNPQQTFPKALLLSVALIFFTMLMGSYAIAMVLPVKKISLVSGVMQAFQQFLAQYHLSRLMPLLTVLLLIGSLGGMVSWIISPAKGLMIAAQNKYLPLQLAIINNHGVPHRILILQAILVTLICLAFLLMPSVNGSYWLLSALSTQLYMFMYVLMFIAAMVLKTRFPGRQNKTFSLWGKRWGTFLVAGLGLVGCFVTIAVGFIPPTDINVGSFWHYELIFAGGMMIMIAPISLLYFYKNLKS